jgi:hypothetical protein
VLRELGILAALCYKYVNLRLISYKLRRKYKLQGAACNKGRHSMPRVRKVSSGKRTGDLLLAQNGSDRLGY